MGWFTRNSGAKLPWTNIESIEQLHEIVEQSSEKPVLLFKHSTRCSISSMALNGFESQWEGSEEDIQIYYLDLLKHREISNEIERVTGVMHQSPQVIVLKNKAVVYTATHSGIDGRAALKAIG